MNKIKKNIIPILLVIILVGAFVRFYKLGSVSFVADEFLDVNSAYAYSKTGQWQSWDFNLGKVAENNVLTARDERAFVYKWPVAMLFKIFPPTEGTARSISVVWGIISIILIYFAGKFFTRSKIIGLLSAFLFVFSISGIEFDRKLRMYAMFLPIYLAFSWVVFAFLEKQYTGKIAFFKNISQKWGINLLFLLPVVLLGALSFLTHQLTVNIISVVGLYLLFWAIASYRKDKKFLSKYSALLFLGILGLIGIVLFMPGKAQSFTNGITFFTTHWEYWVIEFSDYSNMLLAFIFVILGIYFIAKKQNLPKEGSFLALSFFGILFSAIFLWSNNVGPQYIFLAKSFIIILIAAGIFFLIEFLKDNLKENGEKAWLVVLVLALLILPNFGYFFQENNTYRQTSSAENPNYRKIFNYFNKNKKAGDVLITRNFRNYYWSGAGVKVFDMGGNLGKDKMDLAQITKIQAENPSGWLIISGNDENFITKEALSYAEKNFTTISNDQVRGDVVVYRWEN